MSKKRILVVDDDQDLREQVVFFLENNGYEVVQADGEQSGAEVIKNEKFDAAVLDLMMENKDSGFILCHQIKRVNEATPVIMVTGVTKETGMYFDATTREEQNWIKADAFINKDLRFEQLLAQLERLTK
jgi:DNA-binding response OmpR family regulator